MSAEDNNEQNDIGEVTRAVFLLQCKGRNVFRKTVLAEPVPAKIEIRKYSDDVFTANVDCMYNCGAHGGSCNASGHKTNCPYSFDFPYCFDNND